MKTIVKIIWFSVAFTLGNYLFGKFIKIENFNFIMDKLNAPSPIKSFTNGFVADHIADFNSIIVFTIMFLGLDIIHGDIKGAIKGPFQFILNTVLYFIGFTVIFTIFNFII